MPTVVDRRRVALIEHGLPNLPYEHDTRALADDEAEHLVREVKRSIEMTTALAFERLAADLWPEYRVSAITLREPTLPRLPATVREAHASYHVQCRADGMLYHSAICATARQRDWALALYRRGEELAMAAEALKASAQDVERFLNDLKKTLKQPWTEEHRQAFAAAIAALRALSKRALTIDRVEMPLQKRR